jgi:hypothetical protein
MSDQANRSHCRETGRLLIYVAIATLATFGQVDAGVSLEYGQDYQDAYLTACASRQDAQLCSCEITAIEGTVSFEVFAEAVQRSGGDVREDPIWPASVSAIAESCPGLGDVGDE